MLRDLLAWHCQSVICAIAWETLPDLVKGLSVCYGQGETMQGGFNAYPPSSFPLDGVLELVVFSWYK